MYKVDKKEVKFYAFWIGTFLLLVALILAFISFFSHEEKLKENQFLMERLQKYYRDESDFECFGKLSEFKNNIEIFNYSDLDAHYPYQNNDYTKPCFYNCKEWFWGELCNYQD